MLEPIELALLLWAHAAASVEVFASARALLRARPVEAASPVEAAGLGQIGLFRPCAGAEPRLGETLGTSAEAARVAPGLRVVVGVASEGDGAHEAARGASAALVGGGVTASVEVTGTSAANAKSGQLAEMLRRHPVDVVVVADSDVELRGDEVAGLLRALGEPGVGAAWVPPAEVAPAQTAGDRLSQALLCGSLHAFPVLSGIDRGGLVGKLFAVKREALEAAGGFEGLSDVLGEDMELARRLRSAGHAIAVAPGVARSLASGRSVGGVIDRYARWLQVIRAQRPALLMSYPMLFFPTLLLLLAAALLPVRASVAWAAAALAVGGRLVVAASARWVVDRQFTLARLVVDLMFADLLLMTSFFKAMTRRTVEWRGRSLAVSRGGRLSLVGRAAGAMGAMALTLWLGASAAMALPAVGDMGKNVKLEDADGNVVRLETLVGKPILIVYEDKDSGKMNQGFKDELSKLAKGDKYKDKVALAAVADVTDYNYWPVKGFVKDAIRKESKKFNTTIFCDWDGHVRVSYAFTRKTSSIVLLNKQGRVIFASEGKMTPETRKKAIDLLRAEVEG